MKKWPWFVLALVIIVLDQGSKYWIQAHFSPYEPMNILPFLNITMAFNTGAAFSFLHNAGDWHTWFFAGISIFISVLLISWIIRLPSNARLQLASMSLILGGAAGNLIDRLLLGHVIDFIQVFYKQYYWPVFNIADSAICIGAFLLILDLFWYRKRERVS